MTKEVEDGKLCAILSYVLIGIIWYFADEKMKKNAFARYHAKQGLVLMILAVIVTIVGRILMMPLFFIAGIINTIFGIALVVLLIMGIIAAINGQQKPLPVVGQFADKFTF